MGPEGSPGGGEVAVVAPQMDAVALKTDMSPAVSTSASTLEFQSVRR